MHSLIPTIAGSEKFFFSDDFLFQLKLNEFDSIDGWIVHYPIGLNLAATFHGIAVEEDCLIKFSFFIEWRNPNLSGKVLTAYSGEIDRSEEEGKRLTLEWLQVSENAQTTIAPAHKGRDVLYDAAGNNSINERRKSAFFEMIAASSKGY